MEIHGYKKNGIQKKDFNIKRQYEFDGLSVENHAEHGYRIFPLKGVLESPLSIQLRQKFIKSYSLLCVRFSTSFAFIYSKNGSAAWFCASVFVWRVSFIFFFLRAFVCFRQIAKGNAKTKPYYRRENWFHLIFLFLFSVLPYLYSQIRTTSKKTSLCLFAKQNEARIKVTPVHGFQSFV